VIEEIRDCMECGDGTLGRDHQVGFCGCSDGGFDTHGVFLLGLLNSLLKFCCRFGLSLLRPGCFPGSGHFRLPGRLRDLLSGGTWLGGWSGSSFDNTAPSDDVIPPLAQDHLLGRCPARRSFGPARWPVATLFRATQGAYFATAAFPSFHFAAYGSSPCGFPRSHSSEVVPAG